MTYVSDSPDFPNVSTLSRFFARIWNLNRIKIRFRIHMFQYLMPSPSLRFFKGELLPAIDRLDESVILVVLTTDLLEIDSEVLVVGVLDPPSVVLGLVLEAAG